MNLGKENDIKGDSHKLSFYKGNEKQGEAMANIFYDMATNTNVEWRLDYTKSKQFVLSSKHDIEYSPSAEMLGLSLNNLFSTIHSHPNAEPDYKKEIESMGIIPQKDFYGGDYSRRCTQPKDLKSYVFMKKSHRGWMLRPKKYPSRLVDKNLNDIHFSSGRQIIELLKR